MKLDKLITKAREAGIEIPAKPTRGLLMRLIRDSVPATPEELVPFGRYKGYRFCEVPSSYLDWAITETTTGDNSSPDWPRRTSPRRTTPPPQGYKDPESTAVNAPPPAELPPKSASQGDQALKTGSSTQDEEQDSSEQEDTDIELLLRRGLLHDRGYRQLPEDRGPGEDCQPGSARRVKSRAYRSAVNEAIKAERARTNRGENMNSGETEETMQGTYNVGDTDNGIFNLFGRKQNYEVSSEDIGDSNETVDLVPKVNLHYPDDYDQVRKLPSHKMKRVARKRVRSWARQTLGCLMTTLLAFSATALETIGRNTDPVRSWAEQNIPCVFYTYNLVMSGTTRVITWL